MDENISRFRKIHIINYCHQDHAWTNSREWHERRYLAFYDKMLELAEERLDIPITIDNVLHGPDMCLKHRPETKERLQKAIVNGQIRLANGGAALVRPSNSGDELFVRNLISFQRYYKQLVSDAPVSKTFLNADTAIGHNQMPQILKLGGYDLYRIYRPDALLNKKKIPGAFVWKGIDGSKVIVSRGTYSSKYNTQWPTEEDLEKKLELFIKEEVGETLLSLHTADVLAIFCGGDDSIPLHDMCDNNLQIKEFVTQWNLNKNTPELVFSSLDDFLEDLQYCDLPEISAPVDGCDVAYNIPFRGNKSFWKRRFEAERKLIGLEKLASIAYLHGIPYPDKEIEQLWQDYMSFSGHAMEFLLENDFKEGISKASATLYHIESLTKELGAELAQQRATAEENEYIVYNTCNYDSHTPVLLHVTDQDNLNGFRIEDAKGANIPYQIVGWNYGDKIFSNAEFTELDVLCDVDMKGTELKNLHLVKDPTVQLSELATKDVPYFEGRSTRLSTAACEVSILKNEFLEVVVTKGIITLVKDVRCNKVLFCGGEPIGTVRLYHMDVEPEWYSSLNPTVTEEPVITDFFHTENGPLRSRCVADGTIGEFKYRQTIELTKGCRHIHFYTEIFVNRDGFEGYIKALFPGEAMTDIRSGIPFGIQDFHLESNPNVFLDHDRQGIFVSKHYTSYKTHQQTVTVFQGDCGVYMEADVNEKTMGLFLAKGIKNKERCQRWITLAGEDINVAGNNSFQYSVAFDVDAPEELWKEALQTEQACLTFPVMNRGKNNEPDDMRLIEIGNQKIALSAYYQENQKSYIRLFNTSDEYIDTTITTDATLGGAVICDFNDVILEDFVEETLHFHPHEIKTLRFEVNKESCLK